MFPPNHRVTYALTRVQARIGNRPSEVHWRQLSSTPGSTAYLHVARQGPLGSWLAGLEATSSSHEIERYLRARFRAAIEELGEWMPDEWGGALRWTGLLPYLELFAYLLRGGPIYPWMREDVSLFPYLADEGVARTQRLVDSQWAAEVAELPHADDLPAYWVLRWREQIPAVPKRSSGTLKALGDRLLRAGSVRSPYAQDGWQEQRALRSELRRFFHRHVGDPLGAFAYLGMLLIELHSLRAGLVRRALFTEPERQA